METTVNNLTEQVVALMQSGNEKAKAEEKKRLQEQARQEAQDALRYGGLGGWLDRLIVLIR